MTTAEDRLVESKVCHMREGYREIMSDAELESLTGTDAGNQIRSARNRNRCGVLDAYVCWMRDDAAPSDLEFRNGYAVGSR